MLKLLLALALSNLSATPASAYPGSVNWFAPNRISGSLRENGQTFPGCTLNASPSETGVGFYKIVLGGTRVYALGPSSSSVAVCNVSMPVYSQGTHVPRGVSVEWETRVAKTTRASIALSFDATWLERGNLSSEGRASLPSDRAIGTSPLAPLDRRFVLNAAFPRVTVDRMKRRYCGNPANATLDLRFVVRADALPEATWAVAMSQPSDTDLSLGVVRVSFRDWEACTPSE